MEHPLQAAREHRPHRNRPALSVRPARPRNVSRIVSVLFVCFVSFLSFFVMKPPVSRFSNPRVSCKNSIIPYMDLSKWAELPATPPVKHLTDTFVSRLAFVSDYYGAGKVRKVKNKKPPPSRQLADFSFRLCGDVEVERFAERFFGHCRTRIESSSKSKQQQNITVVVVFSMKSLAETMAKVWRARLLSPTNRFRFD